jgi:hypothetical protein
VLADLEFQQLIRLSETAGPGLVWSLENSLSPWGIYFRGGNTSRLQKHMAVTDQVKKLCFYPTQTKNEQPREFESGSLSFLQCRGSAWKSSFPRLIDHTTLCSHWLSTLQRIVIDQTWQTFHKDYSRLIEPWISQVDGAAVFDTLPFHEDVTHVTRSGQTVDELAEFVDVYQNLRLIRAKGLAAELYQLADLYDAHSTRLRMPFAPQTYRSNVNHVPANLRSEARNLVKRAHHTWWGDKVRYKYRFQYSFPALIPYAWSVRFVDRVLHKNASLVSVHGKAFTEKCTTVLQELPSWFPNVLEGEIPNQIAKVSNSLRQLDITQEASSLGTQGMEKKGRGTYCPHTEKELTWLKTFGEVVAWMEVQFPDLLKEVRGDKWDVTPSRTKGAVLTEY